MRAGLRTVARTTNVPIVACPLSSMRREAGSWIVACSILSTAVPVPAAARQRGPDAILAVAEIADTAKLHADLIAFRERIGSDWTAGPC